VTGGKIATGADKMYEQRTASLLPWPKFVRRVARHGAIAAALLTMSMLMGTAGFHLLAGQPWIDALLNAAMLLGGMGPVGEIRFTGGKLFAAVFALYAGLVFLAAAAIVFAPLLHRLVHRFHIEERLRG
jgi:hypothetical protein